MSAERDDSLEAKTSKSKLTPALRRKRALELRLQGRMLWEIATELGVTAGAVSRMLTQTLEKIEVENLESAERLRTLEMVRLEKIGEALYWRAEQGELPAVDRYLKVRERYAKLLGLDLQQEKNEGGGVVIVTGLPVELMGAGEVVDAEVVEIPQIESGDSSVP